MFKRFALLFLVFLSPSLAGEIRLISGENNIAALEITLKPGFKTYWRYPGDNGVPPSFNWEGSKNVKTVEVLFPAPVKFEDGIGHSIGYKKTVLFPLKITPIDDKAGVELTLKLDYAICETMCIPENGEAKLRYTSQANADIANALSLIPEKKLDFAKLISVNDKEITFSLKEQGDVLPEGPDEKWALPFPVKAGDNYKMALEGLPANEKPTGKTLKFTILTATGAYETELTLP